MGCGASKGFSSPVAMSPRDGVHGCAAKGSERLNALLGVSVGKCANSVLSILDAHHQRRFGRPLLKSLDLTHFVSDRGKIVPEESRDELSSAVDESCIQIVRAAFDSLHLKCLPKLGLGCFSIHRHMPIEHPTRVAFETGARLFDFVDPMAISSVDNDVRRIGDDLRTCDLTDGAVLISKPAPFVTAEPGPGHVRASFERLREMLGPLRVGEGQPLIDSYQLVMPFPWLKMPERTPCGCVSEAWKEMEQLVDEGLVRTLAISNFTMQQIDALLAICRIRTCVQTRFQTCVWTCV